MNRKQQHLDELVRRYFEAETTEAEERELCRLLTSDSARDRRYDEVRAVLGFAAAGRCIASARPQPIHRTAQPSLSVLRRCAAVLIPLLMLAGGGFYFLNRHAQEDVCVAIVGGKRVTNADEVMKQMHISIRQVTSGDDELTVESQLADMLGEL